MSATISILETFSRINQLENGIDQEKILGISDKANNGYCIKAINFIPLVFPNYFVDSKALEEAFHIETKQKKDIYTWDRQKVDPTKEFTVKSFFTDGERAGCWLVQTPSSRGKFGNANALLQAIIAKRKHLVVLFDLYHQFENLFFRHSTPPVESLKKTSKEAYKITQIALSRHATFELSNYSEELSNLKDSLDDYVDSQKSSFPSAAITKYETLYTDLIAMDLSKEDWCKIFTILALHVLFVEDEVRLTTFNRTFGEAMDLFLDIKTSRNQLVVQEILPWIVTDDNKKYGPESFMDIVCNNACNVYTLTGPSGSGKSSLMAYYENLIDNTNQILRVDITDLNFINGQKDIIRNYIHEKYYGLSLKMKYDSNLPSRIILVDGYNELSINSSEYNKTDLDIFKCLINEELESIAKHNKLIITCKDNTRISLNTKEKQSCKVVNKSIEEILLSFDKGRENGNHFIDSRLSDKRNQIHSTLKDLYNRNQDDDLLEQLILPLFLTIYVPVNDIRNISNKDFLEDVVPSLFALARKEYKISKPSDLLQLGIEYEKYLCHDKLNFQAGTKESEDIQFLFKWLLPYGAFCSTRLDRSRYFDEKDIQIFHTRYRKVCGNRTTESSITLLKNYAFLDLYNYKNSDVFSVTIHHESYAKHFTAQFIVNLCDKTLDRTVTVLPIPSMAVAEVDVEQYVYAYLVREPESIDTSELARMATLPARKALIIHYSTKLFSELDPILHKTGDIDLVTLEWLRLLKKDLMFINEYYHQIITDETMQSDEYKGERFNYYLTDLIRKLRDLASKLKEAKNFNDRKLEFATLLNYALAMNDLLMSPDNPSGPGIGYHHKAKILGVLFTSELFKAELEPNDRLFDIKDNELFNLEDEAIAKQFDEQLTLACKEKVAMGYSLKAFRDERAGAYKQAFDVYYQATTAPSAVYSYCQLKTAAVALDYSLSDDFLFKYEIKGYSILNALKDARNAGQNYTDYYFAKYYLEKEHNPQKSLSAIWPEYQRIKGINKSKAMTAYVRSLNINILCLQILDALTDSTLRLSEHENDLLAMLTDSQHDLEDQLNDKISEYFSLLDNLNPMHVRLDRWSPSERELKFHLKNPKVNEILNASNIGLAQSRFTEK